MADANSSSLSHVSLGTNRFDQAVVFYDQVLPTLGCKRILAHPGAVAYGREYPEFWVQAPIDGQPAGVGNGTHVGFSAPDKAAVHAFYHAALDAGATSEGEPGPRDEYGEPYYGCFVRDLDGHKIEAAYWDLEQVYELYIAPVED
ncbi:VOC family protein [Pseudomonas sp.]|jgi:catechol 2,3-dioxygenase-like lactoylglutathione lyase family enzyme|uniref:VOC family protein n=1 Tax=Pseudomonas sp. TaxID=306 RepID=UPI0027314137|nr:VOC family protein [Pseudomonas sp.]MDP2242598.1 VOC family protein [Pseudomonas sp.]